MNEPRPWQREADRLGNVEPSDPTGWFETLWASATDGQVTTPWDHDNPHPTLAAWAPDDRLGSAVVVGCGLGADAEHLSRLGYRTTAFDVSPSAVAAARARHPGSSVTYAVGDLLDLPHEWRGDFDLSSRSTRSRPSTAASAASSPPASARWSRQAAPCWWSRPSPTSPTRTGRPGR